MNTVAKRINHKNAFSITEILVVLVVLSILSIIAIPAFNSYSISSKLTDVDSQLAAAKKVITEALATGENLSDINYASGEIPATTSSSEYIDAISISNGVISVDTADSLGLPSFKYLVEPTLDENNQLTWGCETPAEVHSYVQQNCRTAAAPAASFDPRTELGKEAYLFDIGFPSKAGQVITR